MKRKDDKNQSKIINKMEWVKLNIIDREQKRTKQKN